MAIFIGMTELKFRPRFRFRTTLHPDVIRDRLRAHVREKNPVGFRLKGTGPHLVLQYPPEQQVPWTPQLDMDLEMDQQPGYETYTVVRCLIGPAPEIWMMFLGGYIGIAVLSVFGVAIGSAQVMMAELPWGFYAMLPLLALAVVLWLLAQEGKRRSRSAMLGLKHFVDEALGCDCFRLADEEAAR